MKKSITETEKENLIKDIKSGKYTVKEMATNYGYPSIASLHGTMFWWKKQGLLNNSDTLRRPRRENPHNVYLSIDQKTKLYTEYETGQYTTTELAKMYNLPNPGSIYNMINRFRKSKYFATIISGIDIPVKTSYFRKTINPIMTNAQKIELCEYYKNNQYTIEELAKMYGLANKYSVANVVYSFKNSRYFAKHSNNTIPTPIEPKLDVPVQTIITPKGEMTTIRTIHFPDGFTIQIEKAFISGVLIHENGNITIIK